ncbi:MAG TPA: TonB-dependent receptor [Flavihumibacter sp.]|jgi:TonB-linked SusC/RagA family outer membrane protein
MRKMLCMLLCMVVLAGQLLAQTRTIKGRVTDASGNPVANASVVVKGTTVGTTTDEDGNYTITVPDNARAIVISGIGFTAAEQRIGTNTTINVSLANSKEADLQEVVVVGYGTKTVRENTGSISKIKGSDVAALPLPSFDQAMAGKTAGVQVNATGGLLGDRVDIRVRGINSISSSSQPLIVIDGVPQIALSNMNDFNSGQGTRFNPLALLNPNDIESFEVLKDAGASVIYGSRAANGVILITTKKGKKGTVKVNVDSKVSFSKAANMPDLLNGDDFIAINNEKAANRWGAGTVVARESDVDGDGVNDRTDWLDVLFRTGFQQDHGVSFSGGADKLSVFGSVRYIDMEGIAYGNRLRSGQARINMDVTPNKWFKAGTQISYNRTLNNGVMSDRYLSGTVTSGFQAFPTVSPYNPNHPTGYNLAETSPIGTLGWGNNSRAYNGTALFPFNYYNPLAGINTGRNDNTAQDLRLNAYGEITFLKGLKFTSKIGVQYMDNWEDQYTSPYIAGLGTPFNGLVQENTQYWNQWVWQNYLSYDRSFGAHKISATAGQESQYNKWKYRYIGASNFADPFFTTIIDGAYTNVDPSSDELYNLTGGDITTNGMESYFGRLGYSFDSKYFIEGSIRRDAFSGFGRNNEWGTFPSVSAGWEVTKENFMQNVRHLNYLKIRGSYGVVGNSRGIGPYASRSLYSGASYTILNGFGVAQAGNAALQWESSKKFNIGFEASLFKGDRINLVFDYFRTNIDNLILDAPALYTVGIPGSTVTTNIGRMTNAGIEITLNANVIRTRDFSWTASANFSKIKNEVKELVAANNNQHITSGVSVAAVGKPLGTFFIPRWAGVDAETGNPTWYAADGSLKMFDPNTQSWSDGKGNEVSALGGADYVYSDKSGLPTWYGGFDNTFRYKHFDLGLSFFFSGGNYLYNGTRANLLSNSFSNNLEEIKNRWTTPGQKTDIPRLYMLDNTANSASTRWLEKGDFLRLRSLSFGYNLPQSVYNRIGFDNIRVFAQVFNVFTITKYSGSDPEVNTNAGSNIAVGVDTRNVPQPRTLTFGVNLAF